METGQIALFLLLLGSSGVLSDNTDSYVLNCGACAKTIFPNLDSFSCTVSCEVPDREVNITGALSDLKDEINEEKKKTEELKNNLTLTSEILARALKVLDENTRKLDENIRELNESKQELSDTQQALSDTQQALSNTQQELSDTKQDLSATQQELSDTKQELSDIVASQNTPSTTEVAFSVQLSTKPYLAENAIIKYDVMQTNIGGAYSATTGLFTAPSAGLYEFKMRLMPISSSGKVGIFKSTDATYLCRGFSTGHNVHSGCNVVTSLIQGETVSAKNLEATTQYNRIYNSFSGIKL